MAAAQKAAACHRISTAAWAATCCWTGNGCRSVRDVHLSGERQIEKVHTICDQEPLLNFSNLPRYAKYMLLPCFVEEAAGACPGAAF